MFIHNAQDMKVALEQNGLTFIPVVKIRASTYAINAVNYNGGRVTSLMGKMVAGRGKIGVDYKIPVALYARATSATAHPAHPAQPAQRRPNPNTLTGTAGNAASDILGCTGKVGDKFTTKGREYTITGFNLNRPKYAVAITRDDGNKMKASVVSINAMMRQARAA